jgi:hypothetical protein
MFAVSLLGQRPAKKKEETTEPARRAETPRRPWEGGTITPPQADDPFPDPNSPLNDDLDLPLDEEEEDEEAEMLFRPRLAATEETEQTHESARVPFAPLQSSPTLPSGPATAPPKPPEKKGATFFQWVIIVVSITAIAIGLYFLPLGNEAPKPPANGGQNQPGEPEEEEKPLGEEASEMLDPRLFDPEVALVTLPDPQVTVLPYPFPMPILPENEP